MGGWYGDGGSRWERNCDCGGQHLGLGEPAKRKGRRPKQPGAPGVRCLTLGPEARQVQPRVLEVFGTQPLPVLSSMLNNIGVHPGSVCLIKIFIFAGYPSIF